MARIRFVLSPAATAASIIKKIRPTKQTKQVSRLARGRGKVKKATAAYSRLPKKSLLRQWLHLVSLDLFKMGVFFGAASALRFYTPIYRWREYTWPMWYDSAQHLWYGPESISRPPAEILSNLEAAMILSLAPIAVLLFMQIFVRNFWDFNAALMGLLTAVDIMTVAQLPLKVIFPSLRPTFLRKCVPNQQKLNHTWDHLPNSTKMMPLYANIFFCIHFTEKWHPNPLVSFGQSMKDDFRYEMDAFPSGTIGNAFAVGCLLALYLNAKLKAFSANRTPFWKMLVVLAPLFSALIMALIQLLSNSSTPFIAILSALIGAGAGLIGYRTHFHAVFDYHQNHLPFLQGPDKPKPKLPLHIFHLPATIQNHLPSYLHAPHLNLHVPYMFRHRSAEQKRQDEENRWLAVNFPRPIQQHGKKGKGGRRGRKGKERQRRRSREDNGVLMAETIAANVLDAGGGTADAAIGAAISP
ncbi:MAG: hypothetical protein Q9219_002606 [cf. Caloplaca sp. 3 TL-2023]